MFDIKGVSGGPGISSTNREKTNLNEGTRPMKHYGKKVCSIACAFSKSDD